jgi:gas vesicle protein
MSNLKKFLRAAEIAAGTAMYLLEQSSRNAPRMRSKLSDSVEDLRDRASDAYETISDRVSDITTGSDHSSLWNVMRFAAGIGIGIGVGMLIAPADGENTRNRIAEKAQEIGGQVRQRFNPQADLRPTGTGD